VLSFERASARPRVVVFDRPLPLVRWCEENGVRNALVGGFFVRPEHAPLGELRLTGAPAPSVPFDAPWSGLRACVHIDESGLRIEPRDRIEPDPSGDLLQAGPLLVAGGRRTVRDDEDSEGFSAGAHQFDSDITAGRYPRAALAVSRDGGGSASLVHQGRLRNRPREAHGVDLLGGRPVVTAIVFAPV
jgi:hypothetical protein